MSTPLLKNGETLRNQMLAGFAKVRNRQITGTLFRQKTDTLGNPIGKKIEGACALGALAIGFGFDPHSAGSVPWPKELLTASMRCPHDDRTLHGAQVIYHLNDSHHWQIEDIAEYLADRDHRPADFDLAASSYQIVKNPNFPKS